MIKNIAAAAALALSTALFTSTPAQAAPSSFPLPPFGYPVVYTVTSTPSVLDAPLVLHPAYHPAYHPAFRTALTVHPLY
ncbi:MULTISPECIES: hypothetical protein [Streptomyces]|uniref:Uncharacterized protein n=1 Tax=Streptomyces katrae TaxID=68223 RepID=A0ABT7GYH7_9ACTN|nr:MULTISPECIES: hypothetical protein [Streptomyces]MDK9498687.1 hypothetical protein [Streptomyces katrae]RSS99227.1 hypothetical protein EF910_36240 [Streptomyces sp. WAC07149]GLX21746.1 hypothetical protein Slala01_53900 [Streptomyces lavendulae subsp. lavendulae]GLX28379.1 hypothetical protein Slala02_41990 [Streptomyces lavendulae subsp. lavendulae]